MRIGLLLIGVLMTASVAVAQTTQPAEQAGGRQPHPALSEGEVRTLTVKQLGNFEYDDLDGGQIPEDVKRLSGSTIRLTGFMMPLDQADRITRFALVSSLFECCFGQPPQIQHTVTVRTPEGKAVAYYPEEIVVEGTLTVDEKREGEWIVSLFELDVTSIKPTGK